MNMRQIALYKNGQLYANIPVGNSGLIDVNIAGMPFYIRMAIWRFARGMDVVQMYADFYWEWK
jgi:hypothetical protein